MRTTSNVIADGGANSTATQPATQRFAAAVGVVVPFLGLVVAVYGFWGWGVTWTELALLTGMYTVAGLGVTVGYHRLFAHRSFEAVRPVKFLLAVFGSMAVQGPVLKWVAVHRRHHQHSDEPEDPHSPHHYGGGVIGILRGFGHAHVGWIFKRDYPNLKRYVRDLYSDSLIRTTSRFFGAWVLLGLLIPTALGGAFTGTWSGAFLGFLWGGLVRIFIGHHVTWSINSVCHLWGSRPFDRGDQSRNNFLFGVLAFGEGWHNNHHSFPYSARHGLKWWQLDMSYLTIRAMELLGLARAVRVPACCRLAANDGAPHPPPA
ncbi:MAG: fatty acid desaturase [Phycisphaerae bacterium]|nr:fatty acid desaturase [Phycisphaerae bacterium]